MYDFRNMLNTIETCLHIDDYHIQSPAKASSFTQLLQCIYIVVISLRDEKISNQYANDSKTAFLPLLD